MTRTQPNSTRSPNRLICCPRTDYTTADLLAPKGPALDGNTWHHHQNLVTMEEVDDKIHTRFTHYGARAIIKARRKTPILEKRMLNINSYGKAEEKDLAAFEQKIGFTLPNDYRTFLKEHNGGRINNQAFFVEGIEQDVLMRVFFGLNNPTETLNLTFWLEEYKEDIQEAALIIGKEPGGGLLLYVTEGDDKGIYFWDHAHFFPESSEEEGSTYFLADSFTEFCDSLVDFKPA